MPTIHTDKLTGRSRRYLATDQPDGLVAAEPFGAAYRFVPVDDAFVCCDATCDEYVGLVDGGDREIGGVLQAVMDWVPFVVEVILDGHDPIGVAVYCEDCAAWRRGRGYGALTAITTGDLPDEAIWHGWFRDLWRDDIPNPNPTTTKEPT